LLRGLLDEDPSKRWDFLTIKQNAWVVANRPSRQPEGVLAAVCLDNGKSIESPPLVVGRASTSEGRGAE
jgi:hypothetical protein